MLKHTISFKNAFIGIWTAVSTQANVRIHFLVGSFVIFAASYLKLSISEILILILAIAMVILFEMINTAIEFLANAVTLKHNSYIADAKDVAAGAVLISAIFAAIIGLVIFVPKFI